MSYIVKRVYEQASADDGFRVLVDRLWPRGISKEKAHLDEWLKDIAPTNDLRRWYGHVPEKFAEFSARYITELDTNPEPVAQLAQWASEHETVTLLCGAHDAPISQAAVLRDYMTTRTASSS